MQKYGKFRFFPNFSSEYAEIITGDVATTNVTRRGKFYETCGRILYAKVWHI